MKNRRRQKNTVELRRRNNKQFLYVEEIRNVSIEYKAKSEMTRQNKKSAVVQTFIDSNSESKM